MRRICQLLMGLVLVTGHLPAAWAAATEGSKEPDGNAQTCQPKPEEQISGEWLKSFHARCAAAGLSSDSENQMLAPLHATAAKGLPISSLQNKLDEGLAKGISADVLSNVLQKRGDILAVAARLADTAGYDHGCQGWSRITEASALAMEGGLSEADLKPVLDRGAGRRTGLVQAAIEAGEMLVRAGYMPGTAQALMTDCLDRNLRRMEILRMAKIALQSCPITSSAADLRKTLWGSSESSGPMHAGQPRHEQPTNHP